MSLRMLPGFFLQSPVHCAASGGNLELLRWLVEDRHCPVRDTMDVRFRYVETSFRLTITIALHHPVFLVSPRNYGVPQRVCR